MTELRPRVITRRDARRRPLGSAANPAPVVEDSYLAKVVKYIPAEIVAAYVAGAGYIVLLENSAAWLWIWFLFLLVLSPIWTAVMTRPNGEPVAWFQAWTSAVAFLAWVFALGGPFALSFPGSYQAPLGSLALVAVTLLLPVAERLFVR